MRPEKQAVSGQCKHTLAVVMLNVLKTQRTKETSGVRYTLNVLLPPVVVPQYSTTSPLVDSESSVAWLSQFMSVSWHNHGILFSSENISVCTINAMIVHLYGVTPPLACFSRPSAGLSFSLGP